MAAIPLAILALASGVYLLTYVRQFSLGALYKYLSWLVIVLSLLFIFASLARGVVHLRHMRQEHAMGRSHMGPGRDCPYMQGGSGAMHGMPGSMGSCCTMGGCCTKEANAPAACCSKDAMSAKGSCTGMGDGKELPACCQKKMPADSMTKK
jgi:hypothetical protein